MEEKKYIKMSLSTAICIIIIFILIISLVCLGFYIYKIKDNSNNENTTVQEDKTNSTENNSTSNSLETSNSLNNNTLNTTVTNDTGKEISYDDSDAKKVIEKIDFPTYAIASIYNEGKFNLDTISNDLILRLGWSKLSDDNKETIEDNEKLELKETAKKETLKNSILSIFGSKIKYTDKSFINTDISTFTGYNENQGKIIYSNSLYTANFIEGGGGDVPFIRQEINKIIKYDKKIDVYVKTAFVDTLYIDDDNSEDDFEYIIYKNFKNNKFEEKLAETTGRKFYDGYSPDDSNDTVSFRPNLEIAKVIDQLNTYVYTFELDNTTGEYYLSAFNISK